METDDRRLAAKYLDGLEQDANETAELRAEAARLREVQPCGHPVQAIRSGRDKGDRTSNWCGWCADVARLQEVLNVVEWFYEDHGGFYCAWCDAEKEAGHLHDCERQAALSTPAADWLERKKESWLSEAKKHLEDEHGPLTIIATGTLELIKAEVRRGEREKCRAACLKVAGRWTLGENDEWAKAKSYGAEACAAALFADEPTFTGTDDEAMHRPPWLEEADDGI